ncbi:flagellar hook-basal body complex protein FliE [Pseudooceanicola sp. 216_PA32_1]|uniref:Flagellar hook-basal body complex protein FliE n=1 Tax=Pseudooceanicola pacificus TaxID=2676438 RepID=A0A844W1E8_9RHOB|nr:flagellar hook-basal body complex protein FliE [Pseudooceanicola pacificus]MWB76631.1 flagellar hook-basal body complex protein FliE [Pseudooceanicola pacificus]
MEFPAFNAARKYAAARPVTEPVDGAGQAGEALAGLARDFAETLREGEETAKQAMLGQADPHSLVQALAQAELAVETAVTVRDKVVEAYQEILRMPV